MFTGIVLYYILKELGEVKGLIIKSIIRSGNNISIDFKRKSFSAYLHPKYTHIALEKIKGEGFYQSLFRGKVVEDVSQNGLDRLLIIKMSEELQIVFELFGRRSECLLLKGNDIIWSVKGRKKDKYKVPKPPKGLNILEADNNELLSAILNGENISGLTKSFVNRIRDEKKELLEHFVERKFEPTVLDDILSPFSLGYGRKFSTMNDAVIQYFSSLEEKDLLEEKRKEILKEIGREIKRFESVIKDFSSVKDPNDYRLKGEALLTHIREIKKGMKEIKLNYLDKELSIPLDVKLSPEGNAENYFRLYKKAKKKLELAKKGKNKIQKDLEQLRKKRDRILQSEDVEKLLREFDKVKVKKTREKPSHGFREFITGNGYKVLVGKNRESNHRLTFSYARPYDIFLHVKDAPGSHIILRVKDKNKPPPFENIEEAAIIAVRFSKMKKAGLVPVSYTEKKYVKSTKRLTQGKVIMEREKVIYVRLS